MHNVRTVNGTFRGMKIVTLLLFFLVVTLDGSGCSTRGQKRNKDIPNDTVSHEQPEETNKNQKEDQVFNEEGSFDDDSFEEERSQQGGKTETTSIKAAPVVWEERVKTAFPEAPFNLTEVDVVLNAVGGSGGYGDFTGPFFILLELMEADARREKKNFSWNNFVVIVDDYTYFEVLKRMYQFDSLEELNKRFNVHFISLKQAKSIKVAKYIFEFFSGGRNALTQTDHPFFSSRTVRIVSDPMHIRFAPLDFAESKDGRLLFFQPPGIGPRRSGLVFNPEISPYLNKSLSERKVEAIKALPVGPLREILSSSKYSDANFGFIYGAHNTVSRKSAVYVMKTIPELKVQTLKILQDMKPSSSPNHPLIIFSPNSAEVFKMAFTEDVDVNTNKMMNVKDALLNRFTPSAKKLKTKDFLKNLDKLVEVLSPEQFLALDTLSNDKTYIVTTGGINSEAFAALLAISTSPPIIEGNSSVSAAIRLHQGFLMYLSMWNWESINDLMEAEEQCSHTNSNHLRSIYAGNWKVPNFDVYFNQFKTLEEQNTFMAKLDNCIPNFTPKIELVMDVFNQAALIDDITGLETGQIREDRYKSLARRLMPHDVYLAYSLIYNAVQESKIYPHALVEISKEIQKKYQISGDEILQRMQTVYKPMNELNPSEKDLTKLVKRVQPETKLLLNSKGVGLNHSKNNRCYYNNLLDQLTVNDSHQEEFFQIIENHIGKNSANSSYIPLTQCEMECNNLSINQIYESLFSKNLVQDQEMNLVFENVMTKILKGLSTKLALADELRKKKVNIDHKKAFNQVVDKWIGLGKSQLPGLLRESYWETHVSQYQNKSQVLRESLGLDDEGNFISNGKQQAAFQFDFLLEISKETKKVVIPFWYQKERNIFFSSYERKVRGYRGDKPESERTIFRTQFGIVPFDVPELEAPKGSMPWWHWGRDICVNDDNFSMYSRNVGALDIPMVCGISGTTNLVLWSLFASKVDLSVEEVRALLLLTWSTLVVDGGHSLQEVLTATKLAVSYVSLMRKHKAEFRNNISAKTIASLEEVTEGILALDYHLLVSEEKFKRILNNILLEAKGPYYIDYWEDDKKVLNSTELKIQRDIERYFSDVGKRSSTNAKFGYYYDSLFKHITLESFKKVRRKTQEELIQHHNSFCVQNRHY